MAKGLWPAPATFTLDLLEKESFQSGQCEGASAALLFEVSWSSWPFWRVGVELRQIVKKSNLPVSVVARLSMHYGECDERERHDSDLLPLPLIELSAEDEVDSIVQEWDEAPKDEVLDDQLYYSCQRIGEESWVFLMICVLNYLNTGRDLKLFGGSKTL